MKNITLTESEISEIRQCVIEQIQSIQPFIGEQGDLFHLCQMRSVVTLLKLGQLPVSVQSR